MTRGGQFPQTSNVMRFGPLAYAVARCGPRLLATIDIGAGAGILGFGVYLGFRTARS